MRDPAGQDCGGVEAKPPTAEEQITELGAALLVEADDLSVQNHSQTDSLCIPADDVGLL